MFGLPIEVVLSIASLILGWIGESKKQAQRDIHEQLMASRDSADSASKRGGATLRMIIALIVITVGFGGLILAQDNPGGVTQFFDTDPWLDIFGIIKIGGGKEAITAHGLVLPDYVKYSIISIIHFIFGMACGKR